MNQIRLQSFILVAIVMTSVLVSSRGANDSFVDAESIETTQKSIALSTQSEIQSPEKHPVAKNISAPTQNSDLKSKNLTATFIEAESTPNLKNTEIKDEENRDAIPEIKATAFAAKLMNENQNILEKGPSVRWPLASLTKLMTAIISRENIQRGTRIAINENALNSEGASGNFAVGEEYVIEDILKAMLLVSSNDAAEAVADWYGREKFIDAMERKATELKMKQTSSSDPTGLSYLNQSTVEDLEKLIAYINENHPEIFEITTRREGIIRNLKTNSVRKLININALVGHKDWRGGKTGFTNEAEGNLVSLFRNNGDTLLIIVLGTENRFEETLKLYDYLRSR